MPLSRPRLLGLLAGLALLFAAGVGWWAHHAGEVRRLAATAVPARPPLEGWPTELGLRLDAAENAIFGDGDAVAALATLASLYHANGFYPEAQQAYQALRQLQPGEARWLHRAAAIHADFGELDQAIPLWQATVQQEKDYLPARVRLGEALVKSGRTDEAAAAFNQALRLEPGQVHARLGLARVDVARGDWRAARDQLERIATDTAGMLGADLLASAYERTGDTARATALRARQKSHGLYLSIADPWIDEVMEVCFDPFRLALEAGTANLRRDRDRTWRLLDRALRLRPEDANLHFHAGTLAQQMNDFGRARTELETAVRLDPGLTDAWKALVEVLASAGDETGSWRALSAGLAQNPESPVLLLERGRRFKAQGRIEAAMSDLRRVTRLRRDEALAFIELASLHFAQEQTDEGLAVLEQGLEAEPGNPAALAIVTYASIHAGQQARADRWLREIGHQPRVTPPERQRLHQAYVEKFRQPPPPLP